MVRPKRKLKSRIILDGMDFGSSEDPCTNQEPQMMMAELPAVKESGFWNLSLPKRKEAVRSEETAQRKDPSTIQRLNEKGWIKVNQLVSSPGNLMKNLQMVLNEKGVEGVLPGDAVGDARGEGDNLASAWSPIKCANTNFSFISHQGPNHTGPTAKKVEMTNILHSLTFHFSVQPPTGHQGKERFLW